jgi:Zn-dependent protease with chaperone function
MKFEQRPLSQTTDISRGETSSHEIWKNALLLLLGLIAAYGLLGLIAVWTADTIPDRWEAKLAQQGTDSKEPTEPTILESFKRTQGIFANVLSHLQPHRDLDYTLFIWDLDAPNAAAFPGGSIGITPAFLKQVHNELGIAFVLAHELGHHEGRHVLRQMGRTLFMSIFSSLTFGNSGLGSFISILELDYSRQQEKAADLFACELIWNTYHSGQGVTEFFENLKNDSSVLDSRWLTFSQTHPFTDDRIAYISAYFKEKALGHAND